MKRHNSLRHLRYYMQMALRLCVLLASQPRLHEQHINSSSSSPPPPPTGPLFSCPLPTPFSTTYNYYGFYTTAKWTRLVEEKKHLARFRRDSSSFSSSSSSTESQPPLSREPCSCLLSNGKQETHAYQHAHITFGVWHHLSPNRSAPTPRVRDSIEKT